MTEIDIIKVPFYEWTLSDELVESCKNYLGTLKYQDNAMIQSSYNFEYLPVTEFVTNACKELQNKIYPNLDNFNIVPTIFWANKTNFLQKHHKHSHPNSLYSGIIYLTDHATSGATRFYYDNIYRFLEKNNFFTFTNINSSPSENFFDFYPQKGKMIIFPSNIWHETRASKESTKRITISFNTFVKGNLGTHEGKTYLTL